MRGSRELDRLYSLLNHLSLKPEYGGSRRSTPEKRKSVQDEIDILEKRIRDNE